MQFVIRLVIDFQNHMYYSNSVFYFISGIKT